MIYKLNSKANVMEVLRLSFFTLGIWIAIPICSNGAEVWPCPGICFTDEWAFPSVAEHKGVILFDLALPNVERCSMYGLGAALGHSKYGIMVGAQIGLYGQSADTYGAQVSLFNSAGRGAGVQIGLLNVYDDVSFRFQVGLWNSYRLSLNWNYGKPIQPGGYGVQTGFLNMSSEGGHFQFGVFNLANESTVFQFGFLNSMDKKSQGLQIGLINVVDDDGLPLIRWNW